jgi:hypothetical protein
LTLQVQEKLLSLSLSTGKNSSSLGDNIDSGLGLRDSVDYSRATRAFGLTAVKSWKSSDPFAQISSTISKDNTGGECARQAKLLADFGQKIKLCSFQPNLTSSQASSEATNSFVDFNDRERQNESTRTQLSVENVTNNWFQKEPEDLPWDLKDFFGTDGFVSGTSFGNGVDAGGEIIALSPNPTPRNISRDQGHTGRGSGDSYGFPATHSTSSSISSSRYH